MIHEPKGCATTMRIGRTAKSKPLGEVSRWSSTTTRFLSLSLVCLTITALGAVVYFTERGIVASRDWVIHTYQVRSKLSDLQLEVTRSETDETNHRLLLQSSLQPAYQSDLAHRTVEELRRLTRDNVRQQERLEELGQILNQTDSLMSSHSAGARVQISPQELARQKAISVHEKRIDAIVRAMQDEEESLLDQRLSAWNYLFKRNALMLGLAFAIVMVMLAYNFRLLVVEVAETKGTEKRVRDNEKSYRLMSAKILELQDSERRRIARELHDSVGQYLAGLKINLCQLETGTRIDAPKMIHETIAMTESAIQEVRTISHLLHPPLLEELGFLSAARWYVDEYGKRGQVEVALRIDESIQRLPRPVEIALFRVLQESLTNVYRHAAAQRVDISIICCDGHVTLTVADDGKGIPDEILTRFEDGAASGIGLAGMRERLAEFGGEMRVDSCDSGTIIAAVIPMGASPLEQRRTA